MTAPATPIRIEPDALRLEPLALDPADFQSALPRQNHHLIFADPAIGLAVGVWDTTTMQEAFGPYPGDEFITVLDGAFAILDAQGGAVTGSAGHSAVFRNAVPVSWKQEGYLHKIYLTLSDPQAAPPPPAATGTPATASDCVQLLDGRPPGLAVTAGGGSGQAVLFANAAGTMTVTLARHPAQQGAAAPAPCHELCRVLEGEITLTDSAGALHRFGPGAHFFLPRGAVTSRRVQPGTTAYHVCVGGAEQ